MTDPHMPRRSILITGASSGIGRALALEYAGPGRRLTICGRDKDRLDEVAAACREKGAEVEADVVDVRDRATVARWIAAADGRGALDLVIANAGISGVREGTEAERDERIRDIFAVNLVGVLNTISPTVAVMRARGKGQIAIVSSLAAYRGMPNAPAYSASKAAVRAYGEGLRGYLAAHGIAVSVVCPGWVETPMVEGNAFPMPLVVKPERAARIIRRGLRRGKARIAFPWPMWMAAWVLQCLPSTWTDPVLTRMSTKE